MQRHHPDTLLPKKIVRLIEMYFCNLGIHSISSTIYDLSYENQWTGQPVYQISIKDISFENRVFYIHIYIVHVNQLLKQCSIQN